MSDDIKEAGYEIEKYVIRNHTSELMRLKDAVGEFFPLLVELMVSKYLLHYVQSDCDLAATKKYIKEWIGGRIHTLNTRKPTYMKEV